MVAILILSLVVFLAVYIYLAKRCNFVPKHVTVLMAATVAIVVLSVSTVTYRLVVSSGMKCEAITENSSSQ